MSKKAAKNSGTDKTIALNRRARHDYALGDRFEAGLSLQGWELKAIRAGRANIGESYAMIREGEMSKVASLFYLVPAVTAIMAWALFGEHLSLVQLVGMAVATAGVALATAQAPTRARASR